MKRFVEGEDRGQGTLFPERVEGVKRVSRDTLFTRFDCDLYFFSISSEAIRRGANARKRLRGPPPALVHLPPCVPKHIKLQKNDPHN